MTDPAITLVHGRAKWGKFPVSLMRGDEVLLTGQVNPHKPSEIEAFIKRVCRELPGIKDRADDLRSELLQLAAPRPAKSDAQARASDDVPYLATPGGILWRKPTREGETQVPLTNFAATIIANVVRDDGAERETAFEIQAAQGERAVTFTIPAARFGAMNWPTEYLGAEAIVYPGTTVKDHARAAVQMLSPKPIPRRTIYTHTGWRKIGDGWAYLHGGGAIGASGKVEGVQVELPAALSLYKLPDPPQGDNLKAAIRATLGLLALAVDDIILPFFCAIYRAAVGSCDFGVHVAWGKRVSSRVSWPRCAISTTGRPWTACTCPDHGTAQTMPLRGYCSRRKTRSRYLMTSPRAAGRMTWRGGISGRIGSSAPRATMRAGAGCDRMAPCARPSRHVG